MSITSFKVSVFDFLNLLIMGFLLLDLFFGIGSAKDPNWIYISVFSFLFGLVYHQIMEETIGKFLRNNAKIVYAAYDKLKNRLHISEMFEKSEESYLKAYYLIAKNNCLMNIPILEAQITFVRNIWVILIFYLVKTCTYCEVINSAITSCAAAITITVLLLSLPFVWYRLQSKVSYLVWESAYFINLINQKDEKAGSK